MITKNKRRNKILLTILAVIAVLVGGGMGYLSKIDSNIKRPDAKTYQKDRIKVNDKEKAAEGYHSIAIFGVDSRTAELGKGNRSDSVMIASIDNKTKEVKLVSIFRDTLVEIDGHGYDKLAHAYAFGGPELAVNTLNTNFDLHITDFITVNFNVTEKIIDLLGGVTVDVQPDEVKWVNGYVRSLAAEGADVKVAYINGPGEQMLTGSQAVAYSRIRYTSGGDYKRAKRQRIIMNTTLNKAKTQDLLTLNSIIESVSNELYTNLTSSDILSMMKDVFSYQLQETQGFPYHVTNSRIYTQASQHKTTWVGIANMLDEDIKTLHYELYGEGLPSTATGKSDAIFEEQPETTEAPVRGKVDYTPTETVIRISNELKAKLGL